MQRQTDVIPSASSCLLLVSLFIHHDLEAYTTTTSACLLDLTLVLCFRDESSWLLAPKWKRRRAI